MKPEPAAPVVAPAPSVPVLTPLELALLAKLAEVGSAGIIARQLVEFATGSTAVKDHERAHAALASLVRQGLATQDGRRYRIAGGAA